MDCSGMPMWASLGVGFVLGGGIVFIIMVIWEERIQAREKDDR